VTYRDLPPARRLVQTYFRPASLQERPSSAASAAPVVNTVGEATDVTPGHSLEFSTPLSSVGDALFQGTKYTDYHMALQTCVSAVGNSISESASVPAITAPPVEQPSLVHADSSAVTQAPEQAAPEHQDLATPIHSLSVHIH
jgi:hypothetical protein